MIKQLLETQYQIIQDEISRLLNKTAMLTPVEERNLTRLEAEFADIERELLLLA